MMPRRQPIARPARGFTLIELIVVIVVGAIVAGSVALFMRPAIDSFVGTRVRSDIADQADTALRRIQRDVRRAVPNSLRVPSNQCFELVPSASGGRYRMGPDVTNDSPSPCSASTNPSTCAAWVDTSDTTSLFDTLSPLATTPSVGDWVVFNNQNGNDVYEGNNRSAITSVASTPATTQGYTRLGINALQISPGYNGGRFTVVSQSEPSVFYVCSGADGTVDGNGNGKGTLYRLVRSFNATYPTSCPSVSGAVPLATRVQSCSFVYDPNQGATQQSGFLWMELSITRNNETAHLAVGAHVLNVP